MKTLIQYVSALGRQFSTPEEAIADEDRLPRIIATYKGDLPKLVPGGGFGAKGLSAAEADEARNSHLKMIATYEQLWAEVQAQRGQQLPYERNPRINVDRDV